MISSERLLNAARSLGNRLLSAAQTDDPKGPYWRYLSQTMDLEPVYNEQLSLYGGDAGVALFLLELFRQTREPQYRDAAQQTLERAVDIIERQPDYPPGFLTGRLGVSYALLQLARITGEARHRQTALSVAQPARIALRGPQLIDDYLAGRAGALVGLLHLHAETDADWPRQTALEVAGTLCARAEHDRDGLYWDESSQNNRGLCGFSHGAAGVAYVFAMLAHCFNHPPFQEIARQALAYELQHYQKGLGFPDFRKGVYTQSDLEEQTKAFRENDANYFTKYAFMNAWCHGAPGAGHAYLMAAQWPSGGFYQDIADDLINITAKSVATIPGHTICHGSMGNIDLLIQSDNTDLIPREILETVLHTIETDQTFLSGYMALADNHGDHSLFMGDAGIGYQLLRLVDPEQTPSILAPPLPAPFEPEGKLPSTTQLRLWFMERLYPRTRDYLLDHDSATFGPYMDDLMIGADLATAIHHFFAQSPDLLHHARDLYHLEHKRHQLKLGRDSFARVRVREHLHQSDVESQSPDTFTALTLECSPLIHLHETDYLWEQGESGQTAKPGTTKILFKIQSDGIFETQVNDFILTILEAFQTAIPVRDAAAKIRERFSVETEEEAAKVDELVTHQIWEAYASGLLERPDVVTPESKKSEKAY